MPNSLLQTITGNSPPPFALIHRNDGDIELFVGTCIDVERIADLPRRAGVRHDVLALLPYRQIHERGYPYPGIDQTPLTALVIDAHTTLKPGQLTSPAVPTVQFVNDGFDLDDHAYEDKVTAILRDEIGTGAGANFVFSRSLYGRIGSWDHRTALALFKRLLHQEPGAHWTFLVWTGSDTLLGASPERHVTLTQTEFSMNPISGTLRFPAQGWPTSDEVVRFLEDPKEANELYMVLDEELKMTGRICRFGGRVSGPYLKQMSSLAHTEYLIHGATDWDPRDVLRETMFAPTVVGGPLESAAHIIAKHESCGRGYYAGVAALIGTGPDNRPCLDSTILIRTATISPDGQVRIPVGATLVRDSVPANEAAETRSKALGLVRLLNHEAPSRSKASPTWPSTRTPAVQRALQRRNDSIAPFWFADPATRSAPRTALRGKRVLIVDAEDTFTEMAKHLIRALGVEVTIRTHRQAFALADHDLTILGPGPGDPTDLTDPKIHRMHELAHDLLASNKPFFAVCLGHQVLAAALGLSIQALPVPNQGVQKQVTYGGRPELVGFYNSFSAVDPHHPIHHPYRPGPIRMTTTDLDNTTYIDSLRGPGFTSVQFHPASVLTVNGREILGHTLLDLLTQARAVNTGWAQDLSKKGA